MFFLDRCIQCQTLIEALTKAGLQLSLHRDHFADDAEDVQWLPVVAANRWVLLTRDKRIRRHPLEKDCLLIPGARSFILTAGNATGDEMAQIFARHVNKIQRLARNTPAPFIASITRERVTVLYSGTRKENRGEA